MPPDFVDVSSLPLPMLMLDAEGAIQTANLEAQSCIGLSEHRLAGRHLSELFAPEGEIERMLEQAGQSSTKISNYGVSQRANGAPCSLHIGASEEGYVLLMVPEATRSAVEQQAKRQEMAEAVARIALEMAHEVKNPLAALRGAAQLLSEKTADVEDREATEMILAEVDRIRERIDAFLQLGPRAAIEMEAVNIHNLIDEVCRPAEGVVLRRVFDPSLPDIQAHAGRLRQAIENLWTNALEAGASNIEWQTRIAPTVQLPGHKGGVIEARITNDGAAITDEIKARLFEPYVTGKQRGSGLGLALVQRVMVEHEGRVKLETDPYRSSFILHFPVKGGA